MFTWNWPRDVVVGLTAGLLVASTACDLASGSPITPTTNGSTPPAPPTLSVVAGRWVYDLGPGPATKASLWFPSGMAEDAQGDLFVADSFNDVVEKVTPSGELSVVAGDGKQGRPTPGPATSSELRSPNGVAVDASGDLFIADSYNEVVEEVTPAGELSVVAGDGKQGRPTPGAATRSALYSPGAVVVGSQGDLFIADSLNSLVEEVTPAGTLSVVAGDGKFGSPTPGPATSSKLDQPAGLALNASGDLFIADPGNNVVEEVNPAGRLSVVAGDGEPGPPKPGLATGSALDAPTGVAVGRHGDLFIADSRNNVVDEVTPAGRLSVVAGDGEPEPPKPGPATRSALDAPTGVAVGLHGYLFIADSGNNVVEEVTPAGKLSVVAGVAGNFGPPTPGPAASSALSNPYSLAVDEAGDLFIADSGNNVVEKVTPAGRLSVVAGNGKPGPPTPGPATSSDLFDPAGVAVGSGGDLFIADSGNSLVEEVTPAGKLSVVAGDGKVGTPKPGLATKSGLHGPFGVAVDPSGSLFIADWGNNVVEKVTPAGKLSVVAGNGKVGAPKPGPATSSALDGPAGVAVDARGDLFIADSRNDVVERVNPAGRLSVAIGVVGQVGTAGPAPSSKLYWPTGVAVDATGDLFVADSENDVVEELTAAGKLSVVAGDGKQGPPSPGPAQSSSLDFPTGVTVGADGDLFIADMGSNDVEMVTL